nr:hypothetical protein [Bacteroidota bacterium]
MKNSNLLLIDRMVREMQLRNYSEKTICINNIFGGVPAIQTDEVRRIPIAMRHSSSRRLSDRHYFINHSPSLPFSIH